MCMILILLDMEGNLIKQNLKLIFKFEWDVSKLYNAIRFFSIKIKLIRIYSTFNKR
jgi:hypothetical protein